jgi:hypothetical protein
VPRSAKSPTFDLPRSRECYSTKDSTGVSPEPNGDNSPNGGATRSRSAYQMNLRVLSIAYPFAAVGTDSVGGAEQILLRLDQALIRDGHESIVVAPAESRPAGVLIKTPLIDAEITSEVRAKHTLKSARSLPRRWRDSTLT